MMVQGNVQSVLAADGDERIDNNRLLFKKYLLTVAGGWLRINNLFPDNRYTLADYLFDNERIIIDFSRLEPSRRERFLRWFLTPHEEDASRFYLSAVDTSEYRGYTAEVALSYWGRIKNWLLYGKRTRHWQLDSLSLSMDYQLTGMEVDEGEQGLLVGLNQTRTPAGDEKYRNPAENFESGVTGNTKRVYLTDAVIDELLERDIHTMDEEAFLTILDTPHPLSIPVTSDETRWRLMREWREGEFFVTPLFWYQRLWRWIVSLFTGGLTVMPASPEQNTSSEEQGSELHQLALSDTLTVSQVSGQSTLSVSEMRPESDQFVFSGGGSKLFAHIGACKRLHEQGIYPVACAGSSAGAIMALLSYLGYSADEILEKFRVMRQDRLVSFDRMDRSGISDTTALKAALDLLISCKVVELVERYQLHASEEGRFFLESEVFRDGQVTFASLEALRVRCEGSGLGEKLAVTATNAELRATRYFSYETTPHTEVSEAVKISASIPVVYKPTIFDGHLYCDGGVLSNVPTEVFRDEGETFLESDGTSLRVLVLQFDNGPERSALYRLGERVYRESWLVNHIYQFLTGVLDPASGWEQDRIKLRRHALQTILMDVGYVSATQFDLSHDLRQQLVESGYRAAESYLEARMGDSPCGGGEVMMASFSCVEELLLWCCWRKKPDCFKKIAESHFARTVDANWMQMLRARFFVHAGAMNDSDEEPLSNHDVLTEPPMSSQFRFQPQATPVRALPVRGYLGNLRFFNVVYPLLGDIMDAHFTVAADAQAFRQARHALCLNDPCVPLWQTLSEVKGDTHIVVYLLRMLLQAWTNHPTESVIVYLQNLHNALHEMPVQAMPIVFARWSLSRMQCETLLKCLPDMRAIIEQCSGFREDFGVKAPVPPARRFTPPQVSAPIDIPIPENLEDNGTKSFGFGI
ncbi:patatin-like phospholipase family protein [Legionella geestiana]|uniref:Dot/Icm T4SS effector VpdC n=1 Tax=Legionella geestiana TaxID=45065 RepID=UPI001091EAB2|nr:Dot/Icm T4SS effector VpdC [Legionella geestiana]QDQ39001.1 patatin-like phospholipase family protein [Legionella geestiana]